MELSKLQQHIRTLVTLEESEALVISCYLNVEAGLPGCRNAFAERVALLRRAVGPEHKETFEEGLGKTVSFIKDHVQPGTRGVSESSHRDASHIARDRGRAHCARVTLLGSGGQAG
ncbi:MAG: hypothetical protein WBE26_07730 [Phycisphaerae bacterium]